jgi:hypothetical protein
VMQRRLMLSAVRVPNRTDGEPGSVNVSNCFYQGTGNLQRHLIEQQPNNSSMPAAVIADSIFSRTRLSGKSRRRRQRRIKEVGYGLETNEEMAIKK